MLSVLWLVTLFCLSQYKLGKVRRIGVGPKGIPFLVTHDARTIRYPDPAIKVNDTVVVDIKTGRLIDHIKFDTGNLAMVVGGRNMGRVGVVTHRERHAGMLLLVWLGFFQYRHCVPMRLNRIFGGDSDLLHFKCSQVQ